MAVSEFLEDLVSHLPALQLLQQIGYQYLTPTEALELRDSRRSRVVLESILIDGLRKLNQITFKGQTHDFTETNLKNAVDALTNIPFDGLVKTNEQAFDLLTLGKAQEQTIDGNKRSYTLQYIDWEHPENNVYHIADEFEVERTASHELRRPDIVLFVNGIPLAVIECKRPDERDAVEVGISQNLRNQRPGEIPGLFVYWQVLASICQNQGKFATAGTPKKFWSAWKEQLHDSPSRVGERHDSERRATVGGLSESSNVFVLVGESHRSQYGLAHAKMRQVFPNACYIGFTGTPLLKKEKSTATKFGGFIHSYPMRQAVEDKAVTPILYEGRMSELHGDQKAIDKWFERITEDLSDEQKVDLKKKFRREEELTKTSERLYEIAFDLVTHFCENFKGTKFKGQFAVSSKAMALKYHQLFEDIGKEYPERRVSSRVIISAPDTRQDNETIEEEDVPEIQHFWKQMMEQFGSEKKYLDQTIDDFETKPTPEIIICVDKLLTGFDAPCNTVLYIDKRLRDHSILQAIARVNRLFDGKDFGFEKVADASQAHVAEAQAEYETANKPSSIRNDIAGIAAETALKAKKIIDERKIRDWTNNRDVENAMLNELDDLMFAVKGRYELPLTGEDIDEILEGIMRVAKRRETRQ